MRITRRIQAAIFAMITGTALTICGCNDTGTAPSPCAQAATIHPGWISEAINDGARGQELTDYCTAVIND